MFTCHVVYTCHSCRRRGIRAAGEDCVRARARGRTQSDHLPAADLNYPCHYSCQKIVCVRTRADAPALSRRRERAPPPPAKRREGAKTRRLTIRGQEARKRGASRHEARRRENAAPHDTRPGGAKTRRPTESAAAAHRGGTVCGEGAREIAAQARPGHPVSPLRRRKYFSVEKLLPRRTNRQTHANDGRAALSRCDLSQRKERPISMISGMIFQSWGNGTRRRARSAPCLGPGRLRKTGLGQKTPNNAAATTAAATTTSSSSISCCCCCINRAAAETNQRATA